MNLADYLTDHIPGVMGYRLWHHDAGESGVEFGSKPFAVLWEILRDSAIPLFLAAGYSSTGQGNTSDDVSLRIFNEINETRIFQSAAFLTYIFYTGVARKLISGEGER